MSSKTSSQVVKFIQAAASQEKAIEKVILFGSRARGDAWERSDYDIAVVAPLIPTSEWSRWALNLTDNVPTLCGIDLLLITSETSPELLERIRKEGVEIYVRKI